MTHISTRRAAWLATMAVLICTPALSVPAAARPGSPGCADLPGAVEAAHIPVGNLDLRYPALDPIVQRFMDGHWEGSEGPAPHNTLETKVYQSFAITDGAIIFYIGQRMRLPEVDGPRRVSIPRAQLAALLA